MKNSLCPGILAVALIGLGVARGQAPSYPSAGTSLPTPASPGVVPTYPGASPGTFDAVGTAPGASSTVGTGAGAGGPGTGQPGLNDYLTYLRPWGCCGPLGRNGPINSEVYLRPGVSFPVGGNLLGKVLDPGFMIQAGARALFFNPRQDVAWTIDVGISSAWYDAGVDRTVDLVNVPTQTVEQNFFGPPTVIDEVIPRIPLTTSSLNETYVHLSVGQELYLLGLADCADFDSKWRVGYDIGGRWGSSKLVFKEIFFPFVDPDNPDAGEQQRGIPFKHRNDVVGGLFFALHSDAEIPTKCCLFFVGLRTEFAYVWADLLQPQNNTDLMMINVLFNFGLRF